MSTMTTNPPKWWEVYQGDEECKVFKVLSRSDEFAWRTTDTIAKKTGLSVKRVQEIIQKYLPTGIIRQHQTDADKWQYWERASAKEKKDTIANENQKKRVKEAAVQP